VRFTSPFWLPIGFVICAMLVWLWIRVDARQQAALARFVSPHLRKQLTQSISTARRRLQRGLLLTALALLSIALAGPQLGYHWEQINRRGNEIVFIIDTSRSMMTPDVKPNRLDRAKLAIDDFTNHLDGDAVGIVAFAGTAFLVCPITLDYNAFRETLNAIDTNIVPRGGTNISSAIQEAQAALRRRPGSDKIVILVTDGEDLEGSALTTAQNAKQQDGLRIFTVGVGTPGGDLIPLPPAQGGGFVKDDSGQFVKSHLDEAGLKAIADATGGFYVPLGAQGEGLETIYNKVLGSLAKHDLASRQQKIYIERYQWPLAASLAALLLSLLIGNRRRRSRKTTAKRAAAASTTPASSTAAASSTTAALWVAASLVLLPFTPSAHADAPTDTAPPSPFAPTPPSSSLAGPTSVPNAPTSSSSVPSSTSGEPIRAYNAGTAAYRAGQFPQAAQAFQQSITHSPSNDPKRLADQEDAYYNLGNTLYRTGQKSEKSAPQDAIKTWTDAVKAYETALQLKPDDADSKYNRDLVKRKIAKLQQQKPPDQNKDKNDKDKNQDKGQGQGQGGGQGQGQPPPGQQPPQNQPPQQGQPPPGQQQGQPPPGQQPGQQPPPGQQPGQQPPPGQQPGQQPPPGQQPGQQPPPGQQPGQQPPSGDQSQGQPPGASDSDDARAADNQHLPGQMSREEARELLDSVKGDEKRPPGVPMAQDATDVPQQQPTKNW
jgi:Ca-activated chloride channel family protein